MRSTVLVKPDDSDAETKFLTAEVLHGVGSLVIDTYKAVVLSTSWGDETTCHGRCGPPFQLELNEGASDAIAWQCKHHAYRGIMNCYESGAALARI